MIVAFGRGEAVGELMATGITGTWEEVASKVVVAMCCGSEEAGDAGVFVAIVVAIVVAVVVVVIIVVVGSSGL